MAEAERQNEEFDDIDQFNIDIEDELEEEEFEEEAPVEEEVEAKKEEESEEEKYGRKVQKRIDTLTYRAKSAEEREEAERQKRIQVEEELDELRSAASENSLKHLEDRKKAAKARLRTAYEDGGEANEIADAQAELADISSEIAVKRNSKPTPRKKEEVKKEDTGGGSPATNAWVRDNEWMSDPKNMAYRSAAVTLEQQLYNEGYDLDESLYEELDKRLEKMMPGIKNLRGDAEEELKEEEKEYTKERGHQTVVSQGRSGQGVKRGGKPGTRLTQDDLKTMSKYGFDPNSPEDRKAWLNRNKLT